MPRRPTTDTETLRSTTLSVYQGDDKRWLFRCKKRDGTPFPLTGYTAAMQLRTAVADDAPNNMVELDAEVSDPSNGEIAVHLSSSQSGLLNQAQYLWDLEIINTAESWTTTIAGGDVTVTKEVTRSA